MCQTPSRRAGVNWVEIDGDVVVTDPGSGMVHVLRGAAAAVWQLIDGDPVEGLPELIAETFDVDVEVAAADLADALAMLDRIGVLSCGGSSAP